MYIPRLTYTEELAPAFRSEHGSFFLTLKNLNYYQNSIDAINGGINGGINGEINGGINLSETENQILAAIIQNPHITRSDLAGNLGFGTSTVDRTIKKLKDMDILTRIGSNKSGYWDVQKSPTD